MTIRPRTILISRTDSIGDVVLTLPMAGILKKLLPGIKIIFMGRGYTQAVIEACKHVDQFWNWEEIASMDTQASVSLVRHHAVDCIIHVFPRAEIAQWAARAEIPIRIGTSQRIYHWLRCNRRVPLSRKNSSLHEAQLNLKLLAPIADVPTLSLQEIGQYAGMTRMMPLPYHFRELLSSDRFNLVIHPGTHGSTRAWAIEQYRCLLELLPQDRFRVFITGTEQEGQFIAPLLSHSHVLNMTGTMSLQELISFLSYADGMLASSTGPLHIAGVLGKYTLGLYPPIRPMHAGRWAPLGAHAYALSLDKQCDLCRQQASCVCMQELSPEMVAEKLLEITHMHTKQ